MHLASVELEASPRWPRLEVTPPLGEARGLYGSLRRLIPVIFISENNSKFPIVFNSPAKEETGEMDSWLNLQKQNRTLQILRSAAEGKYGVLAVIWWVPLN